MEEQQKKKDLVKVATKLTKIIPDASKVKEHYDFFLRSKDEKIHKLSKTIENLNNVDIKPVTTGPPKIAFKYQSQ